MADEVRDEQEEHLPAPTNGESAEQIPEQSEFGMGFVYPLALFLKHTEHSTHLEEPLYGDWGNVASLWMYAAYDHLYEIVIPPAMRGTKWQMKLERLIEDAAQFRLHWPEGDTKPQNQNEFIKLVNSFASRVEELLMQADRLLGVEPVEASWN